jgi:hypothetical protein
MDDERDPDLVAAAIARHPDTTILIMPREDGQYSNYSPDILGLLDERGVSVEYASDPMATGVHSEKSAECVLHSAGCCSSVSQSPWPVRVSKSEARSSTTSARPS